MPKVKNKLPGVFQVLPVTGKPVTFHNNVVFNNSGFTLVNDWGGRLDEGVVRKNMAQNVVSVHFGASRIK